MGPWGPGNFLDAHLDLMSPLFLLSAYCVPGLCWAVFGTKTKHLVYESWRHFRSQVNSKWPPRSIRPCMVCPQHLVTFSPPPLPSLLLDQAAPATEASPNRSGMVLPQGLCTGCSLDPKLTFPTYLHDFLHYLLQVSVQMSPPP